MGSEDSDPIDPRQLVHAARGHLADGEFAAAEVRLRSAMAVIEASSPQRVEVLYLLAKALHHQHAWNEFPPDEEKCLREAIDLLTQTGELTRAMRLRETLADGLHASGRSREAVDEMRPVLAHKEATLPAGVLIAHATSGLADMLLGAGAASEAVTYFRRATEIAEASDDRQREFSCRFGLGRALLAAGRAREAEAELRRAHAWFITAYPPEGRRAREIWEWVEKAEAAAESSDLSS